MTQGLGLAGAAVLVLGLVLVGVGQAMRRRRGLGEGRTVALDNATFTSIRHGLTGRPDRLVRERGTVIPEEWKSGRRVTDAHRVQMGVYFVVIEEELGVRPPYGVIVLGDGTRHRITNTGGLRSRVIALAAEIRKRRAAVMVPIPVEPTAGQCRACGMRGSCWQARALGGGDGRSEILMIS
jgi:CRISPR/Cas system-associated exonuclease Cas4 (RecB family)